MTAFLDFLRLRIDQGGFSTEDVLASFLPLARETLETHRAGRVAPLEGLDSLKVDGARLWFPSDQRLEPRNQTGRVRRIELAVAADVDVVSELRRTHDPDQGTSRLVDARIGRRGEEIRRPVYLPGYVGWEHELEHHDPLTDVFSLGLVLLSLACNLDLTEQDDLERFVAQRDNLFRINADLHPVLARVIPRMTELNRRNRSQDLAALLLTLENYRYQETDIDVDMARIAGFEKRDVRTKQEFVLDRLRRRLFEISRRNRLLCFRPTLLTVNLTHASVPLSFDIRNIRPDQILIWNSSLHKKLIGGKPLSLNKYLNFNEALYLPGTLNRILTETKRDAAEYGFVQLRLVACFLNWSDLKSDPVESFQSPLILLPVELRKKKGIRDTFTLTALSDEAEVNPVIRHQFQQLYGIELPETIDLTVTDLDKFHEFLDARIQESHPGVTLRKIDRPRIDLVHERAKRKLDQYRRRARIAGRGVRSFMDIDYSYDPANYNPLGIKLFAAKVRVPTSLLREIVEERPRPRSHAVPPKETPVAEKERTLFRVRSSESENPYAWSYDLCGVTLANFRYRKMSLVRDFDALLNEHQQNPAFESVFSLSPRPVDGRDEETPPLDDRFDVVPCDPTQARSIAQARSKESYIIQGPPGTGKSQTITNLIADFVARGLRVLFVCEKRAAIDVVHARLRQCRLGDLCCLIHDSQTDKKQFVMDLKRTYESFLESPREEETAERTDVSERFVRDLDALREFGEAMREERPRLGGSIRSLLDRRCELEECRPTLDAVQVERLPDYDQWRRHRDHVARFVRLFSEIRRDGVLARHPLRLVSPRLAAVDRPLEKLLSALDDGIGAAERLREALRRTPVELDSLDTLARCRRALEYLGELEFLAKSDNLSLLDDRSDRSKRLAKEARGLDKSREQLEEARTKTAAWKTKLPPADVDIALEQAEAFEKNRLAWFYPGWWRLRGILNRSYDFASHAFKPSWTRVLLSLKEEHVAQGRLDDRRRRVAGDYGFVDDVETTVRRVRQLRAGVSALPDWLDEIRRRLMASDRVAETLDGVASARQAFEDLRGATADILDLDDDTSLDALRTDLESIRAESDRLPDFLHCLTELDRVPEALRWALRTLPIAVDQLEAAVADRGLREELRRDPDLDRFTVVARNRHALRLKESYDRWRECNAREVQRRVRDRFLDHVHVAGTPASQLSADQKEFRTRYNRGRRQLEHEFGKSMRYKSIRDLVAGESGDVIRDLKPVWLMSPLSVSDTLPLDTRHVDVVIFDEASQITLEESIPSIFRARQTIVVGDQMQLPPTDFFSARSAEPEEEEEGWIDSEGEQIQYDLESDSFLNHAARNLPSTMLGWHYRSRSESLISFSNWTFYDGRLLTVPEEELPAAGRSGLVARGAEDAEANVDELLRRSVSFHYMEHGVYDHRRNRAEADYIARLVREILARDTGLSIGIVAFSEAQQGEIEEALERLAQRDDQFRGRLDREMDREEDGQFLGLLVKNLENIQGDERDLIVFSICYGRAPDGGLRMNFGPINKSGGEKRLNVAFTRAKKHMAVVTSMRYADITNDYNTGANCLKNYLRYAEAISSGDYPTARLVLRSSSTRDQQDEVDAVADDAVARRIAEALRQRGFLVDPSVGQSDFRCDLAVRRPDSTRYLLGILVDTQRHYAQDDVLEREVMRPNLLTAFGWDVAHVLAKDWVENRQAVLDRLLARLEGQAES